MSDWNDALDLSGFDDGYSAAEVPTIEELTDGKYQVRTDTVRLDQSQNGNPMIKWDLIVLSGPHAGRHIFKNSVITPASLPFVKKDLQVLGIDLAKFSDLPMRLNELLDATLEVSKQQRGEYANVYFNKRITLVPQQDVHAVPPNDNIPF
jgi:hypothetical protein